MTPDQPAARLWNTLAGHALGLVVGFGPLYFLGAQAEPPALGSGVVTLGRVVATAPAVGATVAL